MHQNAQITNTKITVAICALNAGDTIERAVGSALAATSGPIVLVDDHSNDDTAEKAKQLAGEQITIVRPRTKEGIGNARQTALDNIATPFALWLDADDEILPKRVERMVKTLEGTNADLVFDAAELVDGMTGKILSPLPMPKFLDDGNIWHLFERNWLPGLWGGFRTAFARTIGYDPAFNNSEDYDFLLRALSVGAKVDLLEDVGYRYYHYPGTVSRNLKQATSFTGQALAKHTPSLIRRRMMASGVTEGTCAYLASCIGLQSGDAISAINAAKGGLKFGTELVAPYGVPASALCHFITASSLLKTGKSREALEHLTASGLTTVDCTNNMGVCYKGLGDKQQALALFKQALSVSPDYIDAIENIKNIEASTTPGHVTLLPLRPLKGRSGYS